MKLKHWSFPSLYLLPALALPGAVAAQSNPGRVFLPTPETVSIYELNDFPGLADGALIPNGTAIQDLSGKGLNATVEGNAAGFLTVGPGDPSFDAPLGSNRECDHRNLTYHTGRVAVNDDGDAFEMAAPDDFSIELYVNRENIQGAQNWGILAGTFHSRNLLEDSAGNENVNGAWYGYGLIRYQEANGNAFPTGGWSWVLSPVIDGVPHFGLDGAEQHLQPFFEIPAGRHYVVLSVDRAAMAAVGYVDGVEVTRYPFIDPTWSFTTPDGYDHARFLMFNGEDDASRGAYRVAPAGAHLDAVRVQRKALGVADVEEIWSNIQSGVPSPPSSDLINAAIAASSTNVLINQCARLDAAGSSPGLGKAITKYEWRIGAAGTFEEGSVTREVSFDAANPTGFEVSLRITNNAAETSTARVTIKVKSPTVTARIGVQLGTLPLAGSTVIVPRGSALTLDGTASSTDIPAGTLKCPIAANEPVEPLAISEHRWDLDGTLLTIEDMRPVFETAPFETLGEFPITLQVKNTAGAVSQRVTVRVKVADSQGNSSVFHGTPDTILHLELNDLEDGPVADATVLPDLSGNGRDLTIVDAAGGSFEAGAGAPHFTGSKAVNYVGGGNGPRGEILVDEDAFEMDPTEDFTFEIYVRASENLEPQWGDVAGTFRARTDGTDESPRYGWGIIKSHLDQPARPGFAWFTPNQTPDEVPVFFNLDAGIYSYVACVVNRAGTSSTVYVNGLLVSQRNDIDPSWDFQTPAGFPHATFYLFTRVQIDGEFSNCPANTAIDAVRLQGVALSSADVAANWENICSGAGADPVTTPLPNPPRSLTASARDQAVDLTWEAPDAGGAFTGYAVYRDGAKVADLPLAPRSYSDMGRTNGLQYCYTVRSTRGAVQSADSNQSCATPPGGGIVFHRGDSDGNGQLQLTDAVRILNVLFLGTGAIACRDAADADDDGQLQLTDAVRVLNVLFLGTGIIPSPGPPTEPCGSDPGGELGCEAYNC